MDWIAFEFFRGYFFLSLDIALILAFVDQHISIFDLLFGLVATIFATEGLLADIVYAEITNHSVIELVPLICSAILDVGVVVTAVCVANVNHNTLKDIMIVVIRLELLLFNCFGVFLLAQVLT
jgi:hypothetical protein